MCKGQTCGWIDVGLRSAMAWTPRVGTRIGSGGLASFSAKLRTAGPFSEARLRLNEEFGFTCTARECGGLLGKDSFLLV